MADAIDTLINADAVGNWPYRFKIRGREYVMVPGGPSTQAADWAQFRVWNDKGKMTDVKVRATDKVVLLSRISIGSYTEYAEET